MILGLDIGGANTKAASSDGSFAESTYLPLWKGAPIYEALRGLAALGPEAVAVVITGELADCFQSKAEGLERIRSLVLEAFRCQVRFWGIGGFGSSELAGANWSASATLIAGEMGDCLFVDMGSTTTDLIPIKEVPLAASTDYQRLARGELIYMGMMRTPLGSLLPEARLQGEIVPLSPELFAIAADAYLALGLISSDGYSCETPDGRGKDRQAALRRLARCVCADLEEIGERRAMAIVRQVHERVMRILVDAVEVQAERHGLSRVVAAGAGEPLIEEAASFLGMECLRLSDRYGRRISEVFPAYAASRLLELGLRTGT